MRYADIFLTRAEALNELNGPTQETVDLINEVREAAGVRSIMLGDYSSQDALLDFILEERGREFLSRKSTEIRSSSRVRVTDKSP